MTQKQTTGFFDFRISMDSEKFAESQQKQMSSFCFSSWHYLNEDSQSWMGFAFKYQNW